MECRATNRIRARTRSTLLAIETAVPEYVHTQEELLEQCQEAGIFTSPAQRRIFLGLGVKQRYSVLDRPFSQESLTRTLPERNRVWQEGVILS